MNRLSALLLGFAAAALAFASLFDHPVLATCAPLALALAALAPRGGGQGAHPAALVAGGALGTLTVFGRAMPWLAPVAFVAAVAIAALARRPDVARKPGRAPAILLAAGAFAAALFARYATGRLLPVLGLDLGALAAAVVATLCAAAPGAAFIDFLWRRHPAARGALLALPLFGALVAVGFELPSTSALAALAQRVQQPSVTRLHFLLGCGIVVLFAAGWSFAFSGAALAALVRRTSPRAALVAAGVGLCIGLFVGNLAFERERRELRFDDSVRLADGSGAPHERGSVDGRLDLPNPPGWPFAPGAVEGAVEVLRRTTSGRIARIGDGTPEVAAAAVLVLPTALARPLEFGPLDSLLARLRAMAPVVAVCIDLREVTWDDVCCIVRVAEAELPAPALCLTGSAAVVVSGADTGRLPEAALSPAALAKLGEGSGGARALLLHSSRTRFAHAQPVRAARILDRLLWHADALPSASTGAGRELRIRLELCAAILGDDIDRQERLLGLLARCGAADASNLRGQRRQANAALLDFLRVAVVRDPKDADARHRRGTLLARSGHLTEGIADLTEVAFLRPKLTEALAELAEACVLTDVRGRAFELDHYFLGHDDDELAMRLHRAKAECHLTFAHNPDLKLASEREPDLRQALGRFRQMLDFEPLDPESNAGFAEALVELGLAGDAIGFARKATRAAPLEVRGWDVLARCTQGEEREATLAAAAALR